jgi:hypothetical protein
MPPPGRARKTRGGFIVRARHGWAVATVEEVKRRHEAHLMNIRGVIGVGIGRSKDGKDCIRVYVAEDSPKILSAVPRSLDEVDVEVVVSGRFKAL